MILIKPYFVIEDEIDGKKILQNMERYGRTCYKSEEKITSDSAARFIKGIIKSGHESVIEHEKVTVRVICDRGVTHEIVRHRLASYSQESTRYCNYGGGVTFIIPFWARLKEGEYRHASDVFPPKNDLTWEQLTMAERVWFSAMLESERAYIELLRAGWTPQEARSVLPNSLKTELVITYNLREWRHFFRLRCSKKAHPQMREIAIPLLTEFQRRIPVIFDDISRGNEKPIADEIFNSRKETVKEIEKTTICKKECSG